MGTLGAATGDPTAVMVDLGVLGVVNGPEDLADWDAITWSRQEAQVRRLRQRIFKAAQAADFKQVRNLQKLMLRSRPMPDAVWGWCGASATSRSPRPGCI